MNVSIGIIQELSAIRQKLQELEQEKENSESLIIDQARKLDLLSKDSNLSGNKRPRTDDNLNANPSTDFHGSSHNDFEQYFRIKLFEFEETFDIKLDNVLLARCYVQKP